MDILDLKEPILYTLEKQCSKCKEFKALCLFHKKKTAKDGFNSQCKTCKRESQKQYYNKNKKQINEYDRMRYIRDKNKRQIRAKLWHSKSPNKRYEYMLKSHFKMTIEDFTALFLSQHNRCAGCGSNSPNSKYGRWCVDHDHNCCPTVKTCGKCVRGILCSNCNLALGHVNDNIPHLHSLIGYLERYEHS